MPATWIWRYLPHDCLDDQIEFCKSKCSSEDAKYCDCLVVAELDVTYVNEWGTGIHTDVDFLHCCCDNKDRLPKEETAKRRAEFDKNRDKIIKDWEQNTGQSWPKEADGTPYQAHHVEELSPVGLPQQRCEPLSKKLQPLWITPRLFPSLLQLL